MLRRSLAIVVTALLALVVALGSATAAVAGEMICDDKTDVCYEIVDVPGVDPIGSPNPTTGFTPGPTECSWSNSAGENMVVPCRNEDGPWSNKRGCYVSLFESDNPGPPGSAPEGAWYICNDYPDPNCAIRDCWYVSFWLDTPPPGIDTLTAGQAAQRLVDSFALEGIGIGFAPDPAVPGSKSFVGIPIWMWVTNPTPLSYGPYTQTATLGGQTITATAQVTSILWDMGDGTTVSCGSTGTEYQPSLGLVDSPTCGHRYGATSDSQPGGKFTVTATSQWAVTWTSGAQSGTIPLTSTSATAVDINELQAVNVKN